MRIAISLVMDTAKSGTWQVMNNIINVLKKIDKKNEYILYVENTYNNDLGSLPNNFHIVRTSINANLPLLNILWHTFILPVRIMKDKVDILHFPLHSLSLLFKVKPTILTIHDLTEYRLKNYYSKSRILYRKAMLPISSKLADRIIAVSEYTKEEIIRIFKIRPQKILVIYNAANSRYKPINKAQCKEFLRKKYKIDSPFILYVGQIQHPNKNIVRLLHAFSKIKSDFRVKNKLVLVGKSHPSANIVYQTVDELHLNKDLFFTGYIPDEDLPYFYNAASLFVYPSLYEGFGIPVTEAMACGCPVIASDTSSLPEVAGDAGILIDPKNIDEIAKAIIEVLNNSIKREKMVQKGFKQIKKFSWEDSAKKYIEMYESFG